MNIELSEFPQEIQSFATSVRAETGSNIEIERVAAEIVNRLDTILMQDPKLLNVLNTYKQKCTTIGQDVLVDLGSEKFYARVLDISEGGSLVVKDIDNKKRIISAGDVHIVRK